MALQGLYRARSLAEALELLAQDAQARPLAGGATLVAMMNAGVAEPAALVSLRGIEELQGIAVQADGRVRIGAFTRHRETAQSPLLRGAAAVLCSAAGQIANATVRNMGTIGGAIAFADPSLDYPPALVAAGAMVEIAHLRGRREVAAADFFTGWYETALRPGELVSAVLLPKPQAGQGLYVKHARVSGDYATASVAACRQADGRLRVAIGACGPAPLASQAADDLLSGDASLGAVARAGALLQALADPLDDVRGSAAYRLQLIPRLLQRAMDRLQQEQSEAA
jgi:aerobic carbon-monoxide dehydrogenase medium subunit